MPTTMKSEAQLKDPVCGMTVTPETAAGSFEHKGQKYYFCSTHCLKKFEEAPESFISRPLQLPAPQPVKIGSTRQRETHPGRGGSSHICPMHPEIVRGAPGSCPLCGMALEPRTISLEEEANPEPAEMSRRFWVSVVLTIPLFLIGMTEMIPGAGLDRLMPMRTWGWIELALATPVALWGTWPFFVRGWQSIVNRSLNMFTLIAIGVGVSYLFSVIATVFPEVFPHSFREHGGSVPVYFEAAAVITTLVLLGQVLELKALAKLVRHSRPY